MAFTASIMVKGSTRTRVGTSTLATSRTTRWMARASTYGHIDITANYGRHVTIKHFGRKGHWCTWLGRSRFDRSNKTPRLLSALSRLFLCHCYAGTHGRTAISTSAVSRYFCRLFSSMRYGCDERLNNTNPTLWRRALQAGKRDGQGVFTHARGRIMKVGAPKLYRAVAIIDHHAACTVLNPGHLLLETWSGTRNGEFSH